ncbi:LytR/AlgR family response regulator transcription factor [Flavobacterium sp. W21_SRS_FM6]|uniref:LytR/AlgR family response regulator transcription factor n=1 Tax=Flavobacterium sp. W21_SRS_FM6 TaxID=3240268 RepID=UPI003F8F5F72
MYRTLIIDDEPLAHEVLQHHLQRHRDIEIAGHCYNATQALSYLANQQVDLLLLDINMPALSGIELLKVLSKPPLVIIISAYQEYAIQGFELDVADYLLKPVSFERLSQALTKVRKRSDEQHSVMPSFIVLKVDRERRKFNFDDISLIEAYGNYLKVWQGEQVTLVSSTLKQCLQQLPAQHFVQIHKSFVINKNGVCAVDNEHVFLAGGKAIKVGKSFKACLLSLP